MAAVPGGRFPPPLIDGWRPEKFIARRARLRRENSSLTLRPIARGWMNRRWWASAGLLPQTGHGCDATNLRSALSRWRRGSLMVSSLFLDFCGTNVGRERC
jgi:hypothetical protein